MTTSASSLTSGGRSAPAGPSTDVEAEIAFLRREVRELRAAGHVVSRDQYAAQLRAARARASVHVDGVGDIPTGAGSQPIDDLSPQLRMARRHQHGRTLAPELRPVQDHRVLAGEGYRRALAVQSARLLEQEAAQDQERARQVQAHQREALVRSGAFEAHLEEDRVLQRRQELQAEQDAWAASIANSQAEGARRADAQAQAALQAHTSPSGT